MRYGTLTFALLLSLAPGGAQARGVSARLAFDAANAGLNGGNGYKTSTNATGTLAWGESYIMMAYASMFRATGEPAYLVQLADHALNVLARRDSVLGLKDYAGKSRPCWQSTKYSTGSEPFCWVVHSGMITYPMADLVRLVDTHPALGATPVPAFSTTLAAAAQSVLAEVEKTIATHEFEWRTGPASGEGYYLGDPAATFTSVAGKALPLNQMTALGQTLAVLAVQTKKPEHQAKVKGLCAYLRNRMTVSGATLAWTDWGDAWSQGKGEDISHAGINVELAALCHAQGLSFTAQDMGRLGRTLFEKVHVDVNTVADLVDGGGGTNTYKPAVGRWLALAPFEARAWPIAANMFRKITAYGGGELLGLAALAEHAPPLREHSFYSVDWQDLGDYRKATAYGANLVLLPPQTTQPYAFKIGYRAGKQTSVDQWDGKAYHANVRLASTGTAFDSVFAPYDPKIYFAYSGSKALYQLTDTFVAGQGIEIKEKDPVVDPTITTTALPPATAGVAWSAVAQGTGDPPLLWSVAQGPAGLSIDGKTGKISWTPAASDAPGASVTLRLQNDSGEAERPLTIAVSASAGDGVIAGDAPRRDGPAVRPDGLEGGVPPAGDTQPAATAGGCGCTSTGQPSDQLTASLLVLLLVLAARRRARQLSARPAARPSAASPTNQSPAKL